MDEDTSRHSSLVTGCVEVRGKAGQPHDRHKPRISSTKGIRDDERVRTVDVPSCVAVSGHTREKRRRPTLQRVKCVTWLFQQFLCNAPCKRIGPSKGFAKHRHAVMRDRSDRVTPSERPPWVYTRSCKSRTNRRTNVGRAANQSSGCP